MRPASESRTVLIATAIGIVILVLFVLSLGAVLLVSKTGTATAPAGATAGSGTAIVAARAPTTVPTGTSARAASVVSSATNGVPAEAASPSQPAGTAPTAPTTPVATAAPTSPPATLLPVTTAPNTPAGAAAATQSPPTATSAPAAAVTPTNPPTPLPAGALEWPETLPEGMAFVAEDSWPFRVIAPGREAEPFLVFRGGPRWLLIRSQGAQEQPVPRSATSDTLQIGGDAATLIKYQDTGFKLVWKRGGQPLVVSGDGLSTDDLTRTVESLRPLDKDALRARLNQEAARQKLHVTFLWPDFVPEGVSLSIAESIVQLAQPAVGPQADSYRVLFRGGDRLIQVGGGSAEPPKLAGQQERITVGALGATLTSADQHFLLIIDGPGDKPSLIFPSDAPFGQPRLPLVEQGRVFIAADNIDRGQFDQIVSSLQPLRAQAFVARSHGQNLRDIAFRWPTKLPAGYTIDLSTAKVAFDDFVLQGGLPFFELIAAGPNGTTTIRGGRESSGQSLVVPEGPDVTLTTASIHGSQASAARTPDGSIVVWSENGTLFSISSRSLPVEQLVAIGEGLQPVDAAEFFKKLQ